MDVSFVIPLYNCLDLTQAMLASLRATMPAGLSHEIILVDDGSTDGTRDWLRTLGAKPFSVLLNEENLGYAGANNRGVAKARGNLLVLLNSDLVLTPGWLEPMLSLYGSTGDAGAIGNVQLSVKTGQIDHAGIMINGKGKPAHDPTPPDPWSHFREVPAVTGACLLIARSLWADLGGFDPGYINGCEDVDLCFRANTRRKRNLVALRSTIHHHVSASPGRKRRDEANTRRLTLRWRDELVCLGVRAWCRDFVERELNAATAFSAPIDALKIWAHASGVTREAPPVALHAMEQAINNELKRWTQLLGDE